MLKIKCYLRHDNKVNENKELSYCEALRYIFEAMKNDICIDMFKLKLWNKNSNIVCMKSVIVFRLIVMYYHYHLDT